MFYDFVVLKIYRLQSRYGKCRPLLEYYKELSPAGGPGQQPHHPTPGDPHRHHQQRRHQEPPQSVSGYSHKPIEDEKVYVRLG